MVIIVLVGVWYQRSRLPMVRCRQVSEAERGCVVSVVWEAGSMEEAQQKADPLVATEARQCRSAGGLWKTYLTPFDFGYSGRRVEVPYTCWSRYVDHGKPCTDSSQCLGICKMSAEDFSRNYSRDEFPSSLWNAEISCKLNACSGQCSEYANYSDTGVLEISGGKIIRYPQIVH